MFKNFRKNNAEYVFIEFGSEYFKAYIPSIDKLIIKPSVICVSKDYEEVLYIGEEAKSKYSTKTYRKIAPVIKGTIHDYKASELFLHHELNEIMELLNRKTKFLKPNIVASIHSTSSEVEISAYTDVFESFGVSSITFVNESVAALYSKPKINSGIVCKIGYSITDLIIVINNEICYDNTIYFGSSDISTSLQKYIKNKYLIDISLKSTNKLIEEIDFVAPKKKKISLTGKNLRDGLPVDFEITQVEVAAVILEDFDIVISELKKMIEKTSTSELDQLIDYGITVAGGLFSVEVFAKEIKNHVKLNVQSTSPLDATVKGLEEIKNSPELLENLQIKDLIFL
ncbi:rod shape-determining protein [Candidatus Dojkabacteria bacterium]|uniref:Rod shape-determining protein n=1 Tax=Candidatus Dojkabacteria bacterium TaxID=2099670 RepID=A0A955L1H8_9BACT|nr:rod shape-determining protein [Candidatus Dojkabacteria bacterium]